MGKLHCLIFILFQFPIISGYAQTLSDINGNIYKTVQIGSQKWMAENLKATRYRNGDSIRFVIDDADWRNAVDAYCYYENDSNIAKIYGYLYNFKAASSPKLICPNGWHVPTDADWMELTNYLGGGKTAGGKLKDTIYWASPNVGATNGYGFSALPSGIRDYNGLYSWLHYGTCFWSTSLFNEPPHYPIYYLLHKEIDSIIRNRTSIEYGFSIRCVCDTTQNIAVQKDINTTIKITHNPFSGTVYINNPSNQNFEFYLFNITGTCLIHKKSNSTINEIDIQTFENGIYILHLITQNETLGKVIFKN